jgi:hypothetical protein
VGLEGQILAWLAAYSVGPEQLPQSWVSVGLVTAVGGQTAREVDDVGALSAAGGHMLVQSKKALGLDMTESSPLAKDRCAGGRCPADPRGRTAARWL